MLIPKPCERLYRSSNNHFYQVKLLIYGILLINERFDDFLIYDSFYFFFGESKKFKDLEKPPYLIIDSLT